MRLTCIGAITVLLLFQGSRGQPHNHVRLQAPEELEVPPAGAAAELVGLTGVWAAVKYLVSVGSQDMDLIQAHAQCASQRQLLSLKSRSTTPHLF